jgi:hypothetical protein
MRFSKALCPFKRGRFPEEPRKKSDFGESYKYVKFLCQGIKNPLGERLFHEGGSLEWAGVKD